VRRVKRKKGAALSSAEPNAGERFRGQYSFADFTLDVDRRVLCRQGEEVTLRSKSFEVLAYVVDHHGQLVTKAALMDAVWPDTAVTDNWLAQCMVEIRRALDDNSQQLIRTVARRGYVFTAPVTTPAVEFPYQGPISTSEPGPLTAMPSDPGRIQNARTGFQLRRGPVFAAIAGSLIIGMAWFLSFQRVRRLQPNQIRAIAVLPLENL
jgi:DNA-binding winged helix-turn-helix (wHTH) protein